MQRQVRDIMTREVSTVRPDDTVKHAAVVMEAKDIGPIPVCDGERLVGFITDRDITVRAVASGRDPNGTPVREVMTSEVIYCLEDQTVDEVGDLMRERRVRRLPVLDHDKRLVGIVALADLARHAYRPAAEALEGVSKPPEETPTPVNEA